MHSRMAALIACHLLRLHGCPKLVAHRKRGWGYCLVARSDPDFVLMALPDQARVRRARNLVGVPPPSRHVSVSDAAAAPAAKAEQSVDEIAAEMGIDLPPEPSSNEEEEEEEEEGDDSSDKDAMEEEEEAAAADAGKGVSQSQAGKGKQGSQQQEVAAADAADALMGKALSVKTKKPEAAAAGKEPGATAGAGGAAMKGRSPLQSPTVRGV